MLLNILIAAVQLRYQIGGGFEVAGYILLIFFKAQLQALKLGLSASRAAAADPTGQLGKNDANDDAQCQGNRYCNPEIFACLHLGSLNDVCVIGYFDVDVVL